jgi:hypothetical protein
MSIRTLRRTVEWRGREWNITNIRPHAPSMAITAAMTAGIATSMSTTKKLASFAS